MLNSHSIFFFFGNEDKLKEKINSENLQKNKIIEYKYNLFSIDDAREFKNRFREYSSLSENSIILFRIEKINEESQNSLLKICEELDDYKIIFSFPKNLSILDTLLSRGYVYIEEKSNIHFDYLDYSVFKNDKYFKSRFDLLEKVSKENKDTENKLLVKYIIEDLMLFFNKKEKNYLNNMQILQNGLSLLNSPKTSPKQIFEYVCLMIKN
jgi:hypothetical protein